MRTNLKKARKDAGLTQEQMAEKLNTCLRNYNVILMHRPESSEDEILQSRSYDRIAGAFERSKSEGMQLISLDVCKQRQGRTARAWTLFDGVHMRYINPMEV